MRIAIPDIARSPPQWEYGVADRNFSPSPGERSSPFDGRNNADASYYGCVARAAIRARVFIFLASKVKVIYTRSTFTLVRLCLRTICFFLGYACTLSRERFAKETVFCNVYCHSRIQSRKQLPSSICGHQGQNLSPIASSSSR